LIAAASAATSSSSSSSSTTSSAAILAKAVDLSTVHLKTMMIKRAVDCLRSGSSPVSVILQRVITLFATVYSKESISVLWRAKHYDTPGDIQTLREFNASCASAAAQMLRSDLQPTLLRLSKLLSEWPRAWISSLTDWGTTGLYLKPSKGFLAECGVHYSSTVSSVTHTTTSTQQQPCDALWKYCCKIAKSIHFTERDFDDICIDAIQTVVFESIGESIAQLYEIAHKVDDDALSRSYDTLWGISSTQLDLAKELRLDACTQLLPCYSSQGTTMTSSKPIRMTSVWYENDSLSSSSTTTTSNRNGVYASYLFPPPSISLPPKAHLALRVNVLIPLRKVTRGAETQFGVLGLMPTSQLIHDHSSASFSSSSLSLSSSNTLEKVVEKKTPDRTLLGMLTSSSSKQQQQNLSSSNDTTISSFPDFQGGSINRPAALTAFLPAISTFTIIASAAEPNVRLRVLVATVDALCRCASTHRAGVALANAHAQQQQQMNLSSRALSDQTMNSSERKNAITSTHFQQTALLETAHINADDLLGLLCLVLIHARVYKLASRVAMAADYVSEVMLIERPGFFLTSLQAAISYASSDDIKQRLSCGICEQVDAKIQVSCIECGRRLCSMCDKRIHQGNNKHRRSLSKD
jgi:hypothetical protein